MEFCQGCMADEPECSQFCLREEQGYCVLHGKLFVDNLTVIPVCPECYKEDADLGLIGRDYPTDTGEA